MSIDSPYETRDIPVGNGDTTSEPNNTTVTVTTDNGLLDDQSIGYLTALSTLTGRSTKDLGAEAIDALRQSLLPSTKQAKPATSTATAGAGTGRGGRRKAGEVAS